MDKISKLLKKLSLRERKETKNILLKVNKGDLINLDVKKLKGKRDIFRIRKGDLRVIFYKINNSIRVLAIERKSSKTYGNYQHWE